MGPLNFKTQEKAGAWSYPFTSATGEGPISPLITCHMAFKMGCIWHHCHRFADPRVTRQDPKNQFLSALTKITVHLGQLLKIQKLKYSHIVWVPWKFKSPCGLTSAFKTFKSIANKYHTLKLQIKYFAELKHIYFWHETFLIAGKISFQFLAIEYFEFRSQLQSQIVSLIKNHSWSYLLAEAGELTRWACPET